MTMAFRRRRLNVCLLLPAALIICYLVFKDDGSLKTQPDVDDGADNDDGNLLQSLFSKEKLQFQPWQKWHSDIMDKEDENDDARNEMYRTLSDDKDDNYGNDEEEMDDWSTDPKGKEEKEKKDDGFTEGSEDRWEAPESEGVSNDRQTDNAKGEDRKTQETRPEGDDTKDKKRENEKRENDKKSDQQKNNDQAVESADSPTIQQTTVHQARLLIAAYMRTGSSMTGRILQSSPEIFYWYEPLNSLERYYVTGGHPESRYRNRTLNEMFKASAMAAENVSAALSCDILNVYNGTLLHRFMLYGNFGTRYFHACFTKANTTQLWRHCAANMTNFCRQKYKVTAVKSIRLTIARAVEAMRKDPKMKLVHLVRDPRGVLLSRYNIGFANFQKLQREASLLCRKFQEDLDHAPPPGDPLKPRYVLVRYEDIAAAPLNHTHHLYRLVGLVPSREVLETVRRMMASAKRISKCPSCRPTQLNSTEVAQAWRQTLTLEQVRLISKECADVMRRLGYRESFENEAQLRDLSMSAVGPMKVV